MPSSAPTPSQRQLRVGEQLRHIITETLQRGKFHNEVLLDHAPSITVTEVRVTPDLKHAKAYVIKLGGLDMDRMLPALNESSAYFQKQAARQLTTKFTPRIHFVADESFDNAQRIETLLHNLPKSSE